MTWQAIGIQASIFSIVHWHRSNNLTCPLNVFNFTEGLELVPKSHLQDFQDKVAQAYPYFKDLGDFCQVNFFFKAQSDHYRLFCPSFWQIPELLSLHWELLSQSILNQFFPHSRLHILGEYVLSHLQVGLDFHVNWFWQIIS